MNNVNHSIERTNYESIRFHLEAAQTRLLKDASTVYLPWAYREACKEIAEATAAIIRFRDAETGRQEARVSARAA